MRSAALDQLLASYLKQPVRLTWQGSALDAVRGSLAEARLELGGLATDWMSLERVVLGADHFDFRPGVPPHIDVKGPTVELSVGQRQLDRWGKRFSLPFRLVLDKESLRVRTGIAGFPLGEFEARAEISGGWFMLEPKSASVVGALPSYVTALLRTYLPLPPVSPEARLVAIGHEEGLMSLTFEIDDFEDAVTPGLLRRLRRRVLPFL